MQKIFIFFSLLLILPTLGAQPLLVNWQQCMGGTESESGYGIIPLWNGYLLFCGSESGNGQVPPIYGKGDFWLVRTDTLGGILWSKIYGGSEIEQEKKIIRCFDGGFALFGYTYSNDGNVTGNHGEADYWIIKVDSLGNLLWQRAFGGTSHDWSNDMAATPDSGFLLTGLSMSTDGNITGNHGFFDCWIVKLDRNGNLQWEKSLGSTGTDVGISVTTTNDGGYIVAATTDTGNGDVQCNLHGFIDAWIVKLDATGNIEWQKCYGGSQGEGPNQIIQTSDGGYIFAGATDSNDGDVSGNHGENDVWVVKIDSIGILQWQRCYGGTKDDVAKFIRQSPNGTFIVGGYTFSHDGDVSGNHSYPTTADAWVLRISPTGNILWQQCIGGDENDAFADMVEFPRGKITFLGGSNTWDHSGDVQCESHGHSNSDAWVVGVTDTSVVGINVIPDPSPFLKVYPNPAVDVLHFILVGFVHAPESKITLYDLFGQTIHEMTILAGQQEVSFSTGNIPNGLYSFVYTNPKFTSFGKLIIIK